MVASPIDMNGSVALVTGAGSGIGMASAMAFAELGASVVVSDIDQVAGETVVGAIEAAGGAATFVRCDVGSEADVVDLVRRTVATYGRLDFAHNNAGIEGEAGPLAEQSLEDWHTILTVNLTGIFLCMREEIRVMRSQGGGAIVNTASIAGLKGFRGRSAYTASKFGVVGLTKTAALDHAADGVRVNAICPGAILTPMVARSMEAMPDGEATLTGKIPLGRLGQPGDIAAAAVWLCSSQASFVTGTTLVVDGATTAG